jgi:DNA modification methylase
MTVTILKGDCRDVLAALPAASFNCCVTSPPYYWLRDYGVDGQIGHEATVADFVTVLGDVFDEVRRVLTEDGVLWLNLGDSYYSGNGQPMGHDPKSASRNFSRIKLRPLDVGGWDIPKKSLLGIPWLVAMELQRRQWTLRSDVVWCRPTALAEPNVTDRPGRQHEYLFLLSRSRRYWFDKDALPEASVWHIAHERGVAGHNAAFPEELARRCILSGSPAGGAVLDPFSGSGTVGRVANGVGRSATLIDLNPAYTAIATERVGPLFAAAQPLSSGKQT